MLTFVVGFLGGAVLALLTSLAGLDGWIWTPLFFLLGFIGSVLPINLWVKKRLEAIFNGIQSEIQASQDVVRRKAMAMQNKQMSSTKGLQRQLEKQQEAAVRQAIDKLDSTDALKKWNFLVDKQVNTLKAQLYFQIKEFDKADKFFAKSLALEPVTVAMRMVRHYKRDQVDELEKDYKKASKRFTGEKGTILHALRSWMLVKDGRIDDAIAILDKARKDTESPVLQKNWEHLVNGRVRNFSNAGLGDVWYALHLETPKPVRVKQRRGARF